MKAMNKITDTVLNLIFDPYLDQDELDLKLDQLSEYQTSVKEDIDDYLIGVATA